MPETNGLVNLELHRLIDADARGELKCTVETMMPTGDPYSRTAAVSGSEIDALRRRIRQSGGGKGYAHLMREAQRAASAHQVLMAAEHILRCAQEIGTKIRTTTADLLELPKDYKWSYACGRLPSPVTWAEIWVEPEEFFAKSDTAHPGSAAGGYVSALAVEGTKRIREYLDVEFTDNAELASLSEQVNLALFFVTFRYDHVKRWHREILRIGVAWYYDDDKECVTYWPVSLATGDLEKTGVNVSVLEGIAMHSMQYLLHLLEIVNAQGVELETRTAKPKLAPKGGGKKRRVSVEYKELDLKAHGGKRYRYAGKEDDEKEARSRRSPRKHFRRGHFRTCASGKRTWVRSCIVNADEETAVHKTYRVTGSEEEAD
jgi:hypothetical protein